MTVIGVYTTEEEEEDGRKVEEEEEDGLKLEEEEEDGLKLEEEEEGLNIDEEEVFEPRVK